MMKISDETLTGALTEWADEWQATLRGERPNQDNNLWRLNHVAFLGERFGPALIDDLLEARLLPPRAVPTPTLTPPTPVAH